MLVSVIVPVYKVEKYIHRCVDSILAQSFRDFELILVDDGSPDNCGAICEEYAAKDSRIHVIHQANGGLSAARNTGIEWALAHSDSQWLTFIDSDDWIHPQFLQTLLSVAKETGCNVCVCNHDYVSTFKKEQLLPLTVPVTAEVLTAEELLVSHEWNFNYACIKLYRKECFAEIRYPVGKVFEDTYTTFRILFSQKSIAYVDQKLYFYFRNVAGITRAPWTPRELTIFDAMHQQMEFYHTNGYPQAFEKEEKLYVNHHAYQLVRIRENKADWKQNKAYWKQIRKDMLCLLAEHTDKYNRHTMPQCYEAAWPAETLVKRRICNFLHIWKTGGIRGIVSRIFCVRR